MRKNREIPSFVYDPSCVFYSFLGKRDGATFISDDAHGYLCTVTGATWGNQGRTFASGNFISIPAADSAALNFTTSDFTLICRIKPTNLTGNGLLMGRGSYLVDGYYILLVSAGYIEFSTHQSGTRQLTTSANGSILVNTAYTLGITRAGAVVKLYRDGIDFTSSSGTHIDPASANRKFLMGIEADETGSPFIGNYQSAIVYNRALTPQEMLQNHLVTKWRYV